MTYKYVDPSIENQLALEDLMLDLGKGKFLAKLEKERERGQLASTGATAKSIDYVYPVVAEKITAWIESFKEKGVGKRPHAYSVLKEMQPELVAYIGIRVVFDLIMSRGGCGEHKAALMIGTWVEHEARLRAFQKTHKRYLDKLIKEVKRRSQNVDYLRVVTIHAMNEKEDGWKGWSHGQLVSVGHLVIEFLLQCGSIIDRDLSRGSEAHLVITDQAMTWINQTTDAMIETQPIVLPCIEKPLPWSTPYNGGFHSDTLRENYGLLTAFHRKDRNKLLEQAQMPAVYRAINAVQNTGWRVNTKVLDVMKHLWSNSLDMGVLPEVLDLPLPAKPADIDTNVEALKQWKRDATNVYNARVRQASKRLTLKRTIDVASDYAERTFYYAYQCDFRGRLYAQGAGPNPQGTDYQKALLLFAEGKPIGSDAGPFWLRVHLANSYGVDKVSLAERVDWTLQNHNMILAVAADPLANKQWIDADNPWLFLAACFEYAGYIEHGSEFITHLPITVDGSCNGLQHYSAMLRDPIGGAATNLVPADKPQDIYGRVAQVVVAKDPTLNGIVTRAVCKRPVMVLPYGGTIASCKDYVRQALREAGHTFEPERETEIANLVWNSIGDVVVAARDGMAFLRKMASAMSKKKLHVSWVAPSGWPVMQQYFDKKRGRVKVNTLGKLIYFVSYESKIDTVDGRRSGQGLPPNFVHSLDAAALVGMVNLALDNGIDQFAVVHDSFGTLAPDMDMLSGCIRTSFHHMYSDHDVLNELRDRVAEAIGPRAAKNLPGVPERGSLNLDGVLESAFFFA